MCGESRPPFPCLPALLLALVEAERETEPEPERDGGGVTVRTALTSEAATEAVEVLAPDSLLLVDEAVVELLFKHTPDEESVADAEPIAGACVCDCD